MVSVLLIVLSQQVKAVNNLSYFPYDNRLPHGNAVIGKALSVTDEGKFILLVPDVKGAIPKLKQKKYTFALKGIEISKDKKLKAEAVSILKKNYLLEQVSVSVLKASPTKAVLSSIRETDLPKGLQTDPAAELVIRGLAIPSKGNNQIPEAIVQMAKDKHLGMWKNWKPAKGK